MHECTIKFKKIFFFKNIKCCVFFFCSSLLRLFYLIFKGSERKCPVPLLDILYDRECINQKIKMKRETILKYFVAATNMNFFFLFHIIFLKIYLLQHSVLLILYRICMMYENFHFFWVIVYTKLNDLHEFIVLLK